MTDYSNVRIFNPFVYLFSDDLMMFQRIYNFVMKVAMAISLCEYEELKVYLENTVGMNAVSYTHLPSPRDGLLSRMPSSA